MNPLTSRKQLLIAESELNRAQLVADVRTLNSDVRTIAARIKSYGSIALLLVSVVTGLVSAKRSLATRAGAKSSWLPTMLAGGGLISSLWSAFRQPGRPPESK